MLVQGMSPVRVQTRTCAGFGSNKIFAQADRLTKRSSNFPRRADNFTEAKLLLPVLIIGLQLLGVAAIPPGDSCSHV